MDRTIFLKELKKYWEKNNIPNITLENALFLRNILKEKKIKSLLEIGSANGYSTIHFALELEKTGWNITSIEFSQLAYEDAQENFKKAKVDNIIKSYFGDARDIIPLLEETYDFVFIDGLKKRSRVFLELVRNKVENWGIIVIDDVIKFRYKMEDLYKYVKKEKLNYEVLQIDEDDGIMIITK